MHCTAEKWKSPARKVQDLHRAGLLLHFKTVGRRGAVCGDSTSLILRNVQMAAQDRVRLTIRCPDAWHWPCTMPRSRGTLRVGVEPEGM